MQAINKRNSCFQKVVYGSNNSTWRQILLGIVVAANNQDARMMTFSREHEIVQQREVVMVSRKENPVFEDCMLQVDWIRTSRFSDVGWNLDIVAGITKQANQQRIRRVVVKVQSHGEENCRLDRVRVSSGPWS